MHSSKAIVAIEPMLIRIIYKIIKGTKTYTEYGADYFIQQLQQRLLHKNQTLPYVIGIARKIGYMADKIIAVSITTRCLLCNQSHSENS